MTLSIIIPFFNEERRFGKTKSDLENFLTVQKFFEDIELVLVDDGSIDGTLDMLRQFAAGRKAKVISYKKNMGKGHAIRKGMKHATGDYALFLDADMSTKPNEIEKFISEMKGGSDVIIGSRRSEGSQVLIAQPIYRTFMGMVFTSLSNIILGMSIPDFTCGFKCFSKQARENIFSKSLINRWSFDTEILFLAKLNGMEIIPVPVVWQNDRTTTVRIIRDAVKSFLELLKIRVHHAYGRYK